MTNFRFVFVCITKQIIESKVISLIIQLVFVAMRDTEVMKLQGYALLESEQTVIM